MKTIEVPIRHYIAQIIDGSHYKGHVQINGVRMDFELKLEVPIPDLAKMPSPRKCIFDLTLRKAGAIIKLNKEEFELFACLCFMFADSLYNDPRTRIVNNRSKRASIGIARRGKYVFRPEDHKILSHPKFGCSLAA